MSSKISLQKVKNLNYTFHYINNSEKNSTTQMGQMINKTLNN